MKINVDKLKLTNKEIKYIDADDYRELFGRHGAKGIQKITGINTGTLSNFLNGKRSMNEETFMIIVNMIKEYEKSN